MLLATLVSFLVNGFNVGPTDLPETVQELPELANSSASVALTIDGRIVSSEEHRAISFKIDRNSRTVEVLSGYNGNVIKTRTLSNSEVAYKEFLYALNKAGFTRAQEAQYSEENGVCPLGQRVIYSVDEFGENLQRLWSTSCRRSDGTLAVDGDLIRRLFEGQIPDYRDFVDGVRL